MMAISVNVTCAEIQMADGFEYRLPADRFTHFHQSGDCEPLWYSQDNRLIADPSDPQKLVDPVISVSSDHLVMSRCVDELHHGIHCDISGFRLDTIFRVRNESAATPNSDLIFEQWWWLVALFIILILILICFFLRKRIFRCFQWEEQFFCQREDNTENRDLEMLGSDHPRTGSVSRC
ncbi:hypothetical protein QQF64_026241 [Cirrhinus molitorella]|uniref:Uncharacterized protein n=1 Tax=Cirrhinus molitorella TaxID=172907 RepID=A0ABR3NRC1_9TELE